MAASITSWDLQYLTMAAIPIAILSGLSFDRILLRAIASAREPTHRVIPERTPWFFFRHVLVRRARILGWVYLFFVPALGFDLAYSYLWSGWIPRKCVDEHFRRCWLLACLNWSALASGYTILYVTTSLIWAPRLNDSWSLTVASFLTATLLHFSLRYGAWLAIPHGWAVVPLVDLATFTPVLGDICSTTAGKFVPIPQIYTFCGTLLLSYAVLYWIYTQNIRWFRLEE